MKLSLLLLAFVAVTINVAYAAPQGDEDVEIQDLLKALNQQGDDDGDDEVDIQDLFKAREEQDDDDEVDIQSLLKRMNDVEAEQDDAEAEQDDDGMTAQIEEAVLQDFFAKEQVPAKLQGWFKRTWRKVRKVYRKVAPYVRHGVRLYKMYRRYRGRGRR